MPRRFPSLLVSERASGHLHDGSFCTWNGLVFICRGAPFFSLNHRHGLGTCASVMAQAQAHLTQIDSLVSAGGGEMDFRPCAQTFAASVSSRRNIPLPYRVIGRLLLGNRKARLLSTRTRCSLEPSRLRRFCGSGVMRRRRRPATKRWRSSAAMQRSSTVATSPSICLETDTANAGAIIPALSCSLGRARRRSYTPGPACWGIRPARNVLGCDIV